MSKANLEQFMKQVAESDDLQSRIGDEIAGEDLVELGAEHKWEFTTDELLDAAELSDEELERVAGGISDPLKLNTQGKQQETPRLVVSSSLDGLSSRFRIDIRPASDPRML